MTLLEYKNAYFSKKSQFIIFDSDGNVLDSCNTFFELKTKNLFQYFDFLEALKDEIPIAENFAEPLIIPRIESSKKDEIFDFIFKKIDLNNENVNLLIIQNEKDNYQFLKKMQQERNEAILKLNNS